MVESQWTIDTLKELLETRLNALADRCEADRVLLASNADHVAEQLVKQAAEYERRLSDLNHEAARINAANASNVSREVYDADKGAGDEWRRRIEAQLATAVPQSEFRAYKDSTSTALTLQTGKREGIGATGQTIYLVVAIGASVIAMFLGVAALMRGAAVVATAPLYASAPTTTTTTKP